ncbi:hypothetical protein I926_05315 [Pasteurella multocida subsp. multocida OH4807]|nr:hypothetical protein I926_05315 [Pasteurella multocida subsp. multocida OH4807]
MNKIYRTLWNKATQSSVVVSVWASDNICIIKIKKFGSKKLAQSQ